MNPPIVPSEQGVLNDLQRTRLSRRLTSPLSKLSLFLSLPVCRQSSLLTGEGGWGGGNSKRTAQKKPSRL
jgi:hypothetical protein